MDILEKDDSPNRNRGKEPNDSTLFSSKNQHKLTRAFTDLNDLLTKGYPVGSSLGLIGNHWRLNKRQQEALGRACASNQEISTIRKNELEIHAINGRAVMIDGFNLLILLESALSNAFIFECADRTFKDLSGVHGSYKRVNQTNEALTLIGRALEKHDPALIRWVLDEPVSNSRRLKVRMLELAEKEGFQWDVILDKNPDAYLAKQDGISISSDNWILSRSKWVNLGRFIIEHNVPNPEIFRFK